MISIRLLIADDHTLFREGLRAIFRSVPEIEVVGEAANGDEAVRMAADLKPEVILMDIQMPGLSGIEACRQILASQPDLGVIMLTMLEDSDSLFAAIVAGAKGYILKGAGKAEVVKTIRAVADGEALFGPAIASRMAGFFRGIGRDVHTPLTTAPASRESSAAVFPDLTEREHTILDMIAGGNSNHEIAGRLDITPKTVGNHVSNILAKLQVADRTQAALKARAAGMGRDER